MASNFCVCTVSVTTGIDSAVSLLCLTCFAVKRAPRAFHLRVQLGEIHHIHGRLWPTSESNTEGDLMRSVFAMCKTFQITWYGYARTFAKATCHTRNPTTIICHLSNDLVQFPDPSRVGAFNSQLCISSDEPTAGTKALWNIRW